MNIKQMAVDFLAWLTYQIMQDETEDIDPTLQRIMTDEVNAIDDVFFYLGVNAYVSLPDCIYSPTGNFVRYRIAGPGLKLSTVQSYAKDIASAINDNRRSIPGAAKVSVAWRDGLSFDVPYPLTPQALTWDDVAEMATLKPWQMVIGRNYEPEEPCTEILDWNDESLAHLLISGGSGSGKSILLINLITSLAWSTSPDKVLFIILDTKHGPTIKALAGLPHVILCNEVDECVTAVNAVQAELERRKREGKGETKVFLVLEELADLLTAVPDQSVLWQPLIRLSSTSREFGLHMLGCTQYANTDVINPNFRTNFLSRLGGQFATDGEGRVATGRDDLKCSQLPGKGAFYLVHQLKVARIQTMLLKGDALKKVVGDVAAKWAGVKPYRLSLPVKAEMPIAKVEMSEDDKAISELRARYGDGFVDGLIEKANSDRFNTTVVQEVLKETDGRTMNSQKRKEIVALFLRKYGD